MAYPLHDPSATGVPASPDLPAVERRVLELLGGRQDLRGQRRGRGPPATNGDNEYVFYDGPPFANGLPHYGHLFTGYVKDVVPRYQTMRGRRVERRFGWDCHGLPAEVEAEKQLGITTKARDPRAGRGQVQRRLPHLGAGVHPGLGALRHPAGPLGRLRQRLQDPRPGLHGKRHVGLQDPARQGSGLRGLPGAGLLLALRDAAVQHRDPDGRRLPGPARPGADGLVRAAAPTEPARKLGVWTTTPWTLPSNLALAVGPDIEYAVLETRRRALRSSARRGWTRTPRSWRATSRSARCTAATWSGAATRRCSTSSSSRPGRTPSRCSARTSSPPRTAPAIVHLAPGLRRGRPERLQRGRHPDHRHRRRPHPVHRAGPAVRRASRSSTPTSR